MPTKKLPKQRADWKQNTPVQQYQVILGSLAGHFDNLKSGVISPARFKKFQDDHLQQLDELGWFVEHSEKWKPFYS